jgi:uncharacterized protein YueI
MQIEASCLEKGKATILRINPNCYAVLRNFVLKNQKDRLSTATKSKCYSMETIVCTDERQEQSHYLKCDRNTQYVIVIINQSITMDIKLVIHFHQIIGIHSFLKTK